MQIEGKDFGQVLTLPDRGSEALNLLRQGDDLVLHAPTGAGKTYVFELQNQLGRGGRFIPCLLVPWPMINFGNGRRDGALVWLREICDIKPMRPLSLLLWKRRGANTCRRFA